MICVVIKFSPTVENGLSVALLTSGKTILQGGEWAQVIIISTFQSCFKAGVCCLFVESLGKNSITTLENIVIQVVWKRLDFCKKKKRPLHLLVSVYSGFARICLELVVFRSIAVMSGCVNWLFYKARYTCTFPSMWKADTMKKDIPAGKCALLTWSATAYCIFSFAPHTRIHTCLHHWWLTPLTPQWWP